MSNKKKTKFKDYRPLHSIYHTVMTVDPGIHTGFAIWNQLGEDITLREYFQINCKNHNKTFNSKLDWLGKNFYIVLSTRKPGLCIIEGVRKFKSLKGDVSEKSGALVKLCYIVGIYIAYCQINNVKYRIVLAQDWKGQLPNPVVADRVESFTGIRLNQNNQHTIDAIGIGLAYYGQGGFNEL